jgi:hypothetical protein
MKCPRCGHANEAGARFCEQCGAPLPSEGAVPAAPSGCRPGCWVAVVVLVLVVAVIAWYGQRDDDERRSAPLPGSVADVMCDTNETGPGHVNLGGKWYDEDCVYSLPWDEYLPE